MNHLFAEIDSLVAYALEHDVALDTEIWYSVTQAAFILDLDSIIVDSAEYEIMGTVLDHCQWLLPQMTDDSPQMNSYTIYDQDTRYTQDATDLDSLLRSLPVIAEYGPDYQVSEIVKNTSWDIYQGDCYLISVSLNTEYEYQQPTSETGRHSVELLTVLIDVPQQGTHTVIAECVADAIDMLFVSKVRFTLTDNDGIYVAHWYDSDTVLCLAMVL